jgi:hypothetical protein
MCPLPTQSYHPLPHIKDATLPLKEKGFGTTRRQHLPWIERTLSTQHTGKAIIKTEHNEKEHEHGNMNMDMKMKLKQSKTKRNEKKEPGSKGTAKPRRK